MHIYNKALAQQENEKIKLETCKGDLQNNEWVSKGN
jgi:hypothetical protein